MERVPHTILWVHNVLGKCALIMVEIIHMLKFKENLRKIYDQL